MCLCAHICARRKNAEFVKRVKKLKKNIYMSKQKERKGKRIVQEEKITKRNTQSMNIPNERHERNQSKQSQEHNANDTKTK